MCWTCILIGEDLGLVWEYDEDGQPIDMACQCTFVGGPNAWIDICESCNLAFYPVDNGGIHRESVVLPSAGWNWEQWKAFFIRPEPVDESAPGACPRCSILPGIGGARICDCAPVDETLVPAEGSGYSIRTISQEVEEHNNVGWFFRQFD